METRKISFELWLIYAGAQGKLPGASMLRILIYHPVNLFWLRNIISTG
jgi:hypothetical protein